LSDAVRRFVFAVSACKPAIVIVGMGILGIYLLYTTPVVTVQTQSQTIYDLAPPAARRIVMLVISILAFAMMFLMVREEWDWQTRPISDAINRNARVVFAKSLAIWFLTNTLASGLNMMLQPFANADVLELGGIVASCAVLYDVMSFSEMLQDIVKHMLFALLFLVTIVNLFVTAPTVTPFRELAIVAVAATGMDFLASYGVRKRDVIGAIITRVLGPG